MLDGTTEAFSATNEFKNVIEDLTINVSEVTTVGSPVSIDIEQDVDSGEALIDEFIAGYNELMTSLVGLGAPKQGRLAFDPSVRQVKQGITDMVIQSVQGLTGSIDSLQDIGLEINKDGFLQKSTFSSETIETGSQRLQNALSTKLSEVNDLFSSENGIAKKMSEFIGSYIDSDGFLTERQNSLNSRISDIPDEYQALEDRLRSYEDTLRKQFTFLDTTVSQYNATGSYLTSALANISSQSNN